MVRKVSSGRGRLWLFLAAILAIALALPLVANAAVLVNARIEAPEGTLFRGNMWIGKDYIQDAEDTHSITRNTAISTIDEAARAVGFPYLVSYVAPWGLSIDSIDGVAFLSTPPYPGWLYRVNGAFPKVGGIWMGSDSYVLKPGDRVLWYYGTSAEMGAGVETTPIAIRVSRTSCAVNTTITATALEIAPSGVATTPIEGATMHVGSVDDTTNALGQIQMKMSKKGLYSVWAEKNGYVRSDVVRVKVAYRSYVSLLAPSAIRRGQVARLVGKLTSSPGKGISGRRLTVQYWAAGAWRNLRTISTGRYGSFYTWTQPYRTIWYRVVWSGDSSYLSGRSSAKRVVVR